MSRSVKSAVYSVNAHPATTCSLILRIFIVIVLTLQLVDSSAPVEPSGYNVPSNQHTRTRWSFPGEFEEGEGIMSPSSLSNSKGGEFTKNSGFNLRSPDFELTYKVFHTANDKDTISGQSKNDGVKPPSFDLKPISPDHSPATDDEIIEEAYREGILLTPEEWAAQNNNLEPSRQRGDGGFGAGKRIDEGGDHPIVHPYDIDIRQENIVIPKVKPECESATVCRQIESYPTEYVKELVSRNLKELTLLAGSDVLESPVNRIDSSHDIPLCKTTSEIIFLEGARKDPNDANSWQVVLNTEEFRQGVRVENCVNPDDDCTKIDGVSGALASGYRSVCRQRYTSRKLVALSHEINSSTEYTPFQIPTGCCCHVQRILESRFGGSTNPSRQSQSRRFNSYGKREGKRKRSRGRHNFRHNYN